MVEKSNLYISSYSCPSCNKKLLKTVFHSNVTIESGSLKIPIVRAFTCKSCKLLMVPRPGFAIDCMNYYIIRFSFINDDYGTHISALNSLGSTEGISDDPLITRNDFELAANSKMTPACFLKVASKFGYSLDQIVSLYNGWIDEVRLPIIIKSDNRLIDIDSFKDIAHVEKETDCKGDLNSMQILAENLFREGKMTESVELVNKIILKKPDAGLYIHRGNCYIHLNKMADALYSFEKAIELDPSKVNAYDNAASVLSILGNHTKSKEYRKKYYELLANDKRVGKQNHVCEPNINVKRSESVTESDCENELNSMQSLAENLYNEGNKGEKTISKVEIASVGKERTGFTDKIESKSDNNEKVIGGNDRSVEKKSPQQSKPEPVQKLKRHVGGAVFCLVLAFLGLFVPIVGWSWTPFFGIIGLILLFKKY